MINLVDILRYAPSGIKLYSPIFGVVTFDVVNDLDQIETSHGLFSSEGKFDDRGEDICFLWPSKEHKSWDCWQEVLFKDGDIITDVRDLSIYLIKDGQFYDQFGNVVVDLNLKYTRYANKFDKQPELNLNQLVTSLLKYGEEYGDSSFLDILRLAIKDQVDGKIYLETETEYFGRLSDHHKTRPATTKEKDQLFSEMAKLGYEWSVEDKKLVVGKRNIDVDSLVSEYSKLNKPTNSERIAFRNGILAALKEIE